MNLTPTQRRILKGIRYRRKFNNSFDRAYYALIHKGLLEKRGGYVFLTGRGKAMKKRIIHNRYLREYS